MLATTDRRKITKGPNFLKNPYLSVTTIKYHPSNSNSNKSTLIRLGSVILGILLRLKIMLTPMHPIGRLN